MSRRKSPYNNTDEIFAAASIGTRCASDTRVTDARSQQYSENEEESEEELVSQTLSHAIPKKIGHYEIRGTVGEGAFSVVKLAYSPELKQYYACKVIERSRLKHNDLEHRFECEIRVHQQMHHPGIVGLIDILSDEYFYYVFLEFCPGGELFQHIVDSGRLQEDQAKPILKQILEAVNYFHLMGVSHRDMKPENLLLDQVGHTKISDFGLSRFLDRNGLADTPCGSPCYASPECISGAPYDGRTSDCWSVGVILYAMVTGQLPWTKRNQTQLFEQIRRGEYTIPNYLSQTCRNILASLMCVDNKKRLSATQALNHPFLTGVTVPLYNMINTSSVIISLKRVDNFFGHVNSEIDYTLPKLKYQSHNLFDFEKTVKEIIGPKLRKNVAPPKKRAVGTKSGRTSAKAAATSTNAAAAATTTEKPASRATMTTKTTTTTTTTTAAANKTAIKSVRKASVQQREPTEAARIRPATRGPSAKAAPTSSNKQPSPPPKGRPIKARAMVAAKAAAKK